METTNCIYFHIYREKNSIRPKKSGEKIGKVTQALEIENKVHTMKIHNYPSVCGIIGFSCNSSISKLTN